MGRINIKNNVKITHRRSGEVILDCHNEMAQNFKARLKNNLQGTNLGIYSVVDLFDEYNVENTPGNSQEDKGGIAYGKTSTFSDGRFSTKTSFSKVVGVDRTISVTFDSYFVASEDHDINYLSLGSLFADTVDAGFSVLVATVDKTAAPASVLTGEIYDIEWTIFIGS